MGHVPPLPELTLAVPDDLRFIMDLGVAVALALVGGIIAVRLRQPPIVGYLLAGVVDRAVHAGVRRRHGPDQRARRGRRRPPAVRPRRRVLDQRARRVRRIAVPGAIMQILIIGVVAAAIGIPIGLPAAGGGGRRRCGRDQLDRRRPQAARRAGRARQPAWPLGDRLDGRPGPARRSWSSRSWSRSPPVAISRARSPSRSCARRPVPRACLRRRHADAAVAVPVGHAPRITRAVPAHRVRDRAARGVSARAVFGLCLALGAFVAGLIVSESELSHQAAGEITPFRDLFAVLFFVSVGMLLDPAAMVADWPALLALLAVATVVQGRRERRARTPAGAPAAQRAAARGDDRPGGRVQLPARRAGVVARPARRAGLQPGPGHGGRLDRPHAGPRVRGRAAVERLEHAQLVAGAAGRAPARRQPRRVATAGEDGGADRPAVVVLGPAGSAGSSSGLYAPRVPVRRDRPRPRPRWTRRPRLARRRCSAMRRAWRSCAGPASTALGCS